MERLTHTALALAKLARRGLRRLARRSISAELLLMEAGVDVERLIREP
jgi:hypothetical protein